jgi:excisionase family DNA binding protein
MSDRLDTAVRELVEALRDEVRTEAPHEASPPLLSVAEAAARAGVGRTFVYNAISSGRLRSHKLGRRRLVGSADLDAWLSTTR